MGRSAAPIRGRDPEIARLRECLNAAVRGTGAAVLIEGEGGIGKTRLVDALIDHGRVRSVDVYATKAEELERTRPLAAAMRALAPLRDELLDRSVTRAESQDEAAREVLERHALHRPVLFCIEDLHWADAATIAFVRTVASRVEGLPLVVVATMRPPHCLPDLASVAERMAGEGAVVLRLPALDEATVNAIARDLVGADPGPSMRAALERTAGNPFYVVELLTALTDEGAIVVRDGTADVTQTGLPKSVQLTILRRIATLANETADDIRTAALLGASFSIEDFTAVTEISAREALRRLEPALAAGLLKDTGERLAFRHDLVWEAVYEDIPASMRKRLHRDIAAQLARSHRSSGVIAAHMALGAETGDTEAIDWLVRAAEESGTTDGVICGGKWFVEADLLLQAAALCELDDPRRAAIRARAVVCLALANRAVQAVALAEELLDEGVAGDTEPTVRDGFAVALMQLGRQPEAAEQWRIVANSALASPVSRRIATAGLAEIAVEMGAMSEAERLAKEVLAAEPTAADQWPRCMAATVLSLVAGARGRVGEALQRAQEAIPLGDAAVQGGVATLSRARAFAALARADADELDGAIEELHLDHQRLEQQQLIVRAIERQMAITALEYVRGGWDEALVEVQGALRSVFDERVWTFAGVALAARIHIHRGQPVEADRLIAQGDAQFAEFGPGIGVDLLLWVKALLEWEAGRPHEALGLLELVWGATEQLRFAFSTWRLIWPDFVCLALECGNRVLAEEVAASALEGGRAAEGIGSANLSAAWIAGLVSDDAEAIMSAADGLRRTPRVIEAARSSEHAGYALRAKSDDRASEYLSNALDLYEQLNAAHDVDRVRAALREMGVRREARRSRQRATSGWDSLTAAERRVVNLVTDGLTNGQIGERLFVSRRTVQTHLRNVFVKLEMSSRAELAAEAARRGV